MGAQVPPDAGPVDLQREEKRAARQKKRKRAFTKAQRARLERIQEINERLAQRDKKSV